MRLWKVEGTLHRPKGPRTHGDCHEFEMNYWGCQRLAYVSGGTQNADQV
jgi:hypothetical protein